MMNQVVLVGRIINEIKLEENKNGKKEAYITVAVNRNYKNTEGIYETDFIPCLLPGMIAEYTAEYCQMGDIVGIKGTLQIRKNGLTVVVEKLTFLSSKKED